MQRLKVLTLLCAGLLTIFLGMHPAAAEERMVPKVDGFVYFLDHSGSMMMRLDDTGERKIIMAKDLLAKVTAKIPALPYQAAMATFAPYSERVAPGPFEAGAMTTAVQGVQDSYDIFGRQTPMGRGLVSLEPQAAGMKTPLAVIVLSDGEQNLGLDPVEQARAMYAAHPGLCFHVVSFADSQQGQAVLDAIAALNDCSVAACGPVLLADEAALDQFVRDVFYDLETIQEEKAAVVKEAAPVVVEEMITFRSVVFDFDSAVIKGDMLPILDEAASILKARTGQVVLQGHTCSIGPEDYNMGLSQRRAQSVEKYFESKGVPASRMTSEGFGESRPKYDNKTREGRHLNRRVEIELK